MIVDLDIWGDRALTVLLLVWFVMDRCDLYFREKKT